MNSKRIALIIFLIGLIFLSLTIVVYIVRQKTADKNLQTSKLVVPPPITVKNPAGNASSTGPVAPNGQVITEEQINAKIQAKKRQMRKDSRGRRLTDEELLFIGSPRQAAISDLKAGK